MTGTDYKIWCLFEDETSIFSVSISPSENVESLRKLVYLNRKQELSEHADARLALVKVDADYHAHEADIVAGQFRPKADTRPLTGMEKISDVWPKKPSDDLVNIFIRLPKTSVLGKRTRLFGYSWRDGWKQLDDNHPWKLFGDYWRKQNVETTRDSRFITLALDERREGDPKPFLELSTQTDNKIIVRDCYKLFYDFVQNAKDTSGRAGLILTGQPGTGKTVWLAYTLARLLTEKKPVVYHVDTKTYLFFENSVYSRIFGETPDIPRTDHRITCLIDPDQLTSEVDISFITRAGTAFPVIATSPNPSRYKIFEKEGQDVAMQFMPLWTRDELKDGLKLQKTYNDFRKEVETALRALPVDGGSSMPVDDGSSMPVDDDSTMPEDQILSALQMIRDEHERDDPKYNPTVDEVLDRILDNAIEAFGTSARDVYSAIRNPENADTRIDNALKNLEYDDLHSAVVRMHKVEAPMGDVPHRIFSMRVNEDKLARLHRKASFEVHFTSRWIQTRTLKHLEFLQHINTAAKIRELKGWAESSGYAGFLYEGFAAKELAIGSAQPLVLMAASDDKTTFAVPAGKPRTTSSPFNRSRELSYAHFTTTPRALDFCGPGKPLSDYFWLPVARSNSLFDAFIIEFNDSTEPISADVWILQMTLHHGGSPEGYQLIKLIKTKAKQVMQQKVGKEKKVGEVTVKYVLVNMAPAKWKLPEVNWRYYQGDVYYQCVPLSWYVIACRVCPDN